MIGLDPSYKAYDLTVITHINTVFDRLQTLGIGPVDGFMIENDSTMWDDFLVGKKTLNSVKSYMYLSVRILFDPPQTSYLISSFQNQIDKMEWLLNMTREEELWSEPLPPITLP
jgi:hypothetical protein